MSVMNGPSAVSFKYMPGFSPDQSTWPALMTGRDMALLHKLTREKTGTRARRVRVVVVCVLYQRAPGHALERAQRRALRVPHRTRRQQERLLEQVLAAERRVQYLIRETNPG